jgi:hypothetical protein
MQGMKNNMSGDKMANEVIERLARIEAGQDFLCQSIKELHVAFCKVSIQEEKQVQLRTEVNAIWKKLDHVAKEQDKCPITNLKTQVGWIWIFLSSLALLLTGLFINQIVLR